MNLCTHTCIYIEGTEIEPSDEFGDQYRECMCVCVCYIYA